MKAHIYSVKDKNQPDNIWIQRDRIKHVITT